MVAFISFGDLLDEPELNDDYDYKASQLHKTHIMIATSAANVGVSSMWLMVAKHKGFLVSVYDVLQELGCVYHRLTGERGSSSYQIHVSFSSYVSLYLRIMGTIAGV